MLKIGKNRVCILNQPAGLGDILFIIPIARMLIAEGSNVIIPTDFGGLQKHFPDIVFLEKKTLNIDYDEKQIVERCNSTVFPMRFADSLIKADYRNCMAAKYRLFDLPLSLWRTVTWKRDMVLENDLYYNTLGLKDNSKYTLVNTKFTASDKHEITIDKKDKLPIVNMKVLSKYTLLDWGKVIENATNIHTVSTSLLYVLEIMDLTAEEVHIYKREPLELDHKYYDYLITKNFRLR